MNKNEIKTYKFRYIGYTLAIISILITLLSFLIPSIFELSIRSLLSLIIFTSIIVVTSIIIDRKNHEINSYIDRISDGSAALLSSYNRLAKFEKKELYSDFFKQFVRYEPQVQGVQIYNYYLTSFDSQNSIKIEYINGYFEEGHDINAIIQSYYSVDKSKIKELEKSIRKYKLLNEVEDLQDFFMKQITEVPGFFENENYNSAKKDIDDSSDGSYVLALLAWGEMMNDWNIDLGNGILDTEALKYQARNRIGIFKAILKYEFFKLSTEDDFSYKGMNTYKENRNYLSYIVESQTGEKMIYLIVYRTENEQDKNLLKEHILKSFKNLLAANGLVEKRYLLDEKQEGWLNYVKKTFNS